MKGIMIKIAVIVLGIALLLFTTLAIASGEFKKTTYLDAWDQDYYKSFEDPRLQLVSHGILAANGHNMQPWKIELDEDENIFYLYADSNRRVTEVDPVARQSLITQGTFLEYVKVSGIELGYNVDFQLFPNGDYNEDDLNLSMDTIPVAKVTLNKTNIEKNNLYKYMFLNDTNRGLYTDQKLTGSQLEEFESINENENLEFKIYQDEENVNNLSNYCLTGSTIEADITAIFEETSNILRVNEYQKNKYAYGFSLDGFMMEGLLTLFPGMNSEEAVKKMTLDQAQVAKDNTVIYATVNSKLNTRVQQVEAGMLYSRMVLYAHSLGFVIQPNSQVLQEYDKMKEQYDLIHEEYAPDGSTIQMLVRIGIPKTEAPISMRQHTEKFIK